MTSVDTTAGLVPAPEPGFGARLAAVEGLVATWDLHGAQAAARALLDEPGLSPDDRLTARRLLAEALRELGDLDAAYDLAEAVAVQAEQAYGPSDVSTVHAWAVLAAVRHDYDEWDAAEALYHRVLDSGIDESDPEAARVIRLTRVNLALLQRDRGQRPLALAMLNAAYVVHRREYGADDLDTIRIAAELAALHHADGNVPASRRLFTLAHAAARSRLGSRHPFTKAVEWELAAVEAPMPASPVPPAAPVSGDVPDPRGRADPERLAGADEAFDLDAGQDDVLVLDAGQDDALDLDDQGDAFDLDDQGDALDPDGDPDGALDLESALDAQAGPDGALDQDGALDARAGVDGRSDPDDGLDDPAAPWRPPDEERAPVRAPAGVVGAGSLVHVASAPAAMGHPGVVDTSVVGERRFVVPLKAVAAVAVGALAIAAASVLWQSGDRSDTAAPPAGTVTSTPGPTGTAATAGAAGSAAGAGTGGTAGAGTDGAGTGGAETGGAGTGGTAGQGGAGAGGELARVRDLRLQDEGTALAVTWTGLQSKAVVALSRAGGPPVVVAEVPPGTTSYVVKGVDPVAAYCVVVGPVDATVAVTAATSVCTGQR